MHKPDVIEALRRTLQDELSSLERTMQMAVDEATSGESRAENKYDTRATEASYLAAGQGERVLALRRLVALFNAEEVGVDLYGLQGDDGPAWFLLAPDGGGRRAQIDGTEVVVVTRASPVGAALVAGRVGDTVTIGRGGAEFEIVGVW